MRAKNSVIVSQKEMAEPGEPGKPGASGYSYRPRGLFASGQTYVWDSEYRDICLKDFNGTVYTFRVRVKGSSVTAAPSLSAGDANWEAANELKFVATELLMANNAIINMLQSNDLFIKKANGTVTAGLSGKGTGVDGIRFWAGSSDPNTAPFRVNEKGGLVAENADIKGTVNGITGSFKSLNCINTEGEVVGQISFDESGKFWFSGDMQHQGYDYEKKRGFRFLTTDLWCRGGLGESRSTVMKVRDYTARYCVNGLNSPDADVVVQLEYAQSTSDIRLGGLVGDAAGFQVNMVIFNCNPGSNKYRLIASPGKRVMVINANNAVAINIYLNGYELNFPGGTARELFYIGNNNMNPVPDGNLYGSGWMAGATFDNNW